VRACGLCLGLKKVTSPGGSNIRPCPCCDGRGWDDGLADSEREADEMRGQVALLKAKVADLEAALARREPRPHQTHCPRAWTADGPCVCEVLR
jgi:hypothetical protein